MITLKDKLELCFIWNSIKIEDDLWFVPSQINGLYRFSIKNNHGAVLEAQFHKEDVYQEELYGSMVKWNRKLILAPINARKVAIYDIDKQYMEYISLPLKQHELEQEKYSYCTVYKDIVYFVGKYSDMEIILLNLSTGCIEKTGCVPNKIIETNTKELIGYITLFDHFIYIPVRSKNIILEYNIQTCVCKKIDIDFKITEQVFMVCNMDNRLLVGFERKVFEWDRMNNTYTEIVNFPVTRMCYMACKENSIYAFDSVSPCAFLFHIVNKTFIKLDLSDRSQTKKTMYPRLMPIYVDNCNTLLLSLYSNEIIRLNNGMVDQKYHLYTCEIPDLDRSKLYSQRIAKESNFYKSNLKDYIQNILDFDVNNIDHMDLSIGNRIHRFLMKS